MGNSNKIANQYDNDNFNYLKYWDGRDYEHAAEEIAIHKLLKKGHYSHAIDVGGGYGRLCVLLEKYADSVTLAEPSKVQLDLAKTYLAKNPKVSIKQTQADALDFKNGSADLVTMIRVMHHLPDPTKEFEEIARVLKDGGIFVLEIANYAHARNRLKFALHAKRLPVEPVDIRSKKNRRDEEVAFVNHNPKTVAKQLAHAGFKLEKVLSVSNLRSTTLKKILPKNAMLTVERLLQPTLAKTYFGPSIFFLLKKVG